MDRIRTDYGQYNVEANQWDTSIHDFKEAFREGAVAELIAEVESSYLDIGSLWNTELLCAIEAYRNTDDDEHRLLAFLRSYRSIDWYTTEVANMIATTLTEPFLNLFKETKGVASARWLINRNAIAAMREGLLSEVFQGTTVLKLIKDFFKSHAAARNSFIHGLAIPSPTEVYICLSDAIAIFNEIDSHLNETEHEPIVLSRAY